MFHKLRRKIIITNLILFGILVFVLLGTVYGLAYTHMTLEVDEYLEKALLSARDIDYWLPTSFDTNTFDSNSLIIFISMPDRGIIKSIGGMQYNNKFLNSTINRIMKEPRANGRTCIDNRNLAFNVSYALGDEGVVRIVVYDYTILNKSTETLLYILIGAYAISMLSLVFILTVYADKAIKPIEEAFYRQKELVANASHELKTPLTIIDTNLSVLNSSKSESIESNKKWFDNIATQSQRMLYLINDMLELAKVDTFQGNIIIVPINISNILEGVLLSMEAGIFENGINVSSNIAKDIVINGNNEGIEKLLYILIDNAIKYTHKDGQIEIKLYTEKRRCILSIKNSGSGISKDKLPKLFERFYRADESHSQDASNSFGLGLAIAKNIVDSLGAVINVESKENEYTKFILTFKVIQSVRFEVLKKWLPWSGQ